MNKNNEMIEPDIAAENRACESREPEEVGSIVGRELRPVVGRNDWCIVGHGVGFEFVLCVGLLV